MVSDDNEELFDLDDEDTTGDNQDTFKRDEDEYDVTVEGRDVELEDQFFNTIPEPLVDNQVTKLIYDEVVGSSAIYCGLRDDCFSIFKHGVFDKNSTVQGIPLHYLIIEFKATTCLTYFHKRVGASFDDTIPVIVNGVTTPIQAALFVNDITTLQLMKSEGNKPTTQNGVRYIDVIDSDLRGEVEWQDELPDSNPVQRAVDDGLLPENFYTLPMKIRWEKVLRCKSDNPAYHWGDVS